MYPCSQKIFLLAFLFSVFFLQNTHGQNLPEILRDKHIKTITIYQGAADEDSICQFYQMNKSGLVVHSKVREAVHYKEFAISDYNYSKEGELISYAVDDSNRISRNIGRKIFCELQFLNDSTVQQKAHVNFFGKDTIFIKEYPKAYDLTLLQLREFFRISASELKQLQDTNEFTVVKFDEQGRIHKVEEKGRFVPNRGCTLVLSPDIASTYTYNSDNYCTRIESTNEASIVYTYSNEGLLVERFSSHSERGATRLVIEYTFW